MKKLVIFDLDGTLLYTLEDLTDSVNFALQKLGCPVRTLAEIQGFVGNGVGRLVRLSLPTNVSEKDFEKCFSIFKEHYAQNCCVKTRPYHGIVEVLDNLKEKGFKVAVVSNKFNSAAIEVCNYYFKGKYDMAVGEGETIRRKPFPDGVFKILNDLHCEKHDTMLFGDSEVDYETAKNAGIDFTAVLWGFRDRRTLEDNGVARFIEKPCEVIEIVSR